MAEQKPPDALWCHAPVPYVVRLRAALSEDAKPELFERHVTAYSVYEAMMQAMLEIGGAVPDTAKFTIESIGPDMPVIFDQAIAALVGKRK